MTGTSRVDSGSWQTDLSRMSQPWRWVYRWMHYALPAWTFDVRSKRGRFYAIKRSTSAVISSALTERHLFMYHRTSRFICLPKFSSTGRILHQSIPNSTGFHAIDDEVAGCSHPQYGIL